MTSSIHCRYTSPCLCLHYLIWSRGSIYGYRIDALYSAPCSHQWDKWYSCNRPLRAHLVQMMPRGDKKETGRNRDRQTERGTCLTMGGTWQHPQLFVDRRCCAHDRDRVRNATHQCRLAGRAGRCCLRRDMLASMRCHMWIGETEQTLILSKPALWYSSWLDLLHSCTPKCTEKAAQNNVCLRVCVCVT